MNKQLGRLPELADLYGKCQDSERELNDKIFKSLTTLYPYIFKNKFSTHGWYIKNLLTGFNNVSSYEEISGDINDENIMREILLGISYDTQELIDIGLGALYADFKKNMVSSELKYAGGNLDEAKRFAGLYHMMQESFPGASIKDTAPKNFGESVLYDMQISFPLDFKDKAAGQFNINIENKSGITSNARASNFHFGSVSNKSITGGDLTYKNFLDEIQDISLKYLQGLTIDDGIVELRKIKDRFLKELAIQYIKWRLENNYPVFTSSLKDGVVLCSEILYQMIHNEMMSFDEGTEDPGNKILKYYKSSKGIEHDTIFENKTFKNMTKEIPGMDNIRRSLRSEPETLQSLNRMIREGHKISPSFKISLWYGK